MWFLKKFAQAAVMLVVTLLLLGILFGAVMLCDNDDYSAWTQWGARIIIVLFVIGGAMVMNEIIDDISRH